MGLARRTVGEQMPTRFWNFKRRGGAWWDIVGRLEGPRVFFSMSGSVERGSEGERERCFRNGVRISEVDAMFDSIKVSADMIWGKQSRDLRVLQMMKRKMMRKKRKRNKRQVVQGQR